MLKGVIEERGRTILNVPRNPPIRHIWTNEGVISLSSVQSRNDCRAEVIVPHTPSIMMSGACEAHTRPVEKSIASLALRLR